MKQLVTAALLAAGLSGLPANAQDAPSPPSCETMEHNSDFDFWVGEWNVYAPDGQFAGRNSIRLSQGDCLIEEHWSGASGSTGFSMNFYDPLIGQWRQVWMSAGAYIDYAGGLNADGAMFLEGEIFYHQNGTRFPFRGLWTPNEDGSVTQHFTQYDPETESWNDWFTGRYVRQETDPDAPSGE